jgi:hypothetical protein
MLQDAFSSLLLRRISTGAATLLLAGGLYLLYVRNPAAPGFFPPCPFLFLTGFYCPGCGALRTLHELMHFRFAHALELNVLVVISTVPLTLYFTRCALAFCDITQLTVNSLPKSLYYAVLGVLLTFWLLRNLPWYPFSLLAPH